MTTPEEQERTVPHVSQASGVAPKTPRNRGVDLARGIAMFGMFAVHVGPPADEGGIVGGLMYAAQGRSAILFATLAGVSLALMTGGRTPKIGQDHRDARRRILIRAALLVALGTGLKAYGTPVAVILAYYGIFFLFTVPFLRMRSRTLLIVAATVAAIGPVLVFVARTSPTLSDILMRIDALDPIFRLSGEGLTQLTLAGTYPAVTWLPFLLTGVVLGRFGINRLQPRVLAFSGAGLMLLGYGGAALAARFIEVPQRNLRPKNLDALLGMKNSSLDVTKVGPELYESFETPGWQGLFSAGPHTGTIFEIVGGIGTALLVLGIALALSANLPQITWPIAAVGTMSLTIYTAHVIAINCLGQNAFPNHAGWLLMSFIGVSMAFATLWLRLYDRGPLEKVMHEASVATFWRRKSGPR